MNADGCGEREETKRGPRSRSRWPDNIDCHVKGKTRSLNGVPGTNVMRQGNIGRS